MTVSLKHTFQSAKPDGTDASLVQPSNWNAEHELTIATNKLLGRATAGTGAAEELSVGTALSISGGTLAVTTVPVANGGTGATTLTANNVLLGNGTSAVQLVAPGTSGNVLTSDGTTWASTPSGIASKYDLISTAVASSTTNVDFTGLSSTYAQYVLVVSGFYVGSIATLNMYTSSNNGSSYDSGAGNYKRNEISCDNTGAVSGSSSSATSINLGIPTTSTTGSYLAINMVNAGVSEPFSVEACSAKYISTGYQDRIVGFRDSSTAVNAIRLTAGATNLNGTFRLYGIKAA
jgi:hypothetical protein